MASTYQDLRVWQQSMDLAEALYRAAECFPKYETYGLASQMRRAAVSVPCNIAEGKGRRTDKEFALYLFHARGSLLEIETQVHLARRLQYLGEDKASELLGLTKAVGSSLAGLINSVR